MASDAALQFFVFILIIILIRENFASASNLDFFSTVSKNATATLNTRATATEILSNFHWLGL
ncbi:hypothetical protein O6H91_14G036900 [Diphasiastrum complanatum]|uniref:Uncharacterized protein n=1 Tax=Diphasiastrum complanatum TaxID=34168 RepID=A0ACC2BN90_DIPCM|nr:hypothetical protein O6H91_14G036900 [Diphasiastrum complanatum]